MTEEEKEIMKRVRFIRKSKEITQKDLAKKLNLNVSNYSPMERGERGSLTLRKLNIIAETLKVSRNYLITGIEDNSNLGILDLQNLLKEEMKKIGVSSMTIIL